MFYPLQVNQILYLAFLFVDGVAAALLRPHCVKLEAVNTWYLLKWEWNHTQVNHTVMFTTHYILSEDPYETSLDRHRTSALKCQPCDTVSRTSMHYVSDTQMSHGDLTENTELYTVACNQTRQHQCDFTPYDLNYFACYKLRVRAEGPNDVSNWCYIQFCPLENASLGPPSLVNIISSDSFLMVHIIGPMTSKNVSMDTIDPLSFNVNYWEAHDPQKVQTKKALQRTVPLHLKPWTLYCVQVNAFSEELNKSSPFTAQQCAQTKGKGIPIWSVLLLVFFCVLLLSILVLWFYKGIRRLFPIIEVPSTIQNVQRSLTPLLQLPSESFTILDALEEMQNLQPMASDQ